MSHFIIAQLWIYPVKSLGGFSVPSAAVTSSGSLIGDREWLVIDPAGNMLWQGDIPKMTVLTAAVRGEYLEIACPTDESIVLPVDHDGETIAVTMYGHHFSGISAGREAAEFLSDALGSPCRLVRIGQNAHNWSGLNPVHVVSSQSVDTLNSALAQRGDPPVEVQRFRANVVLDGEHAPFAEEEAPVIKFHGAELRLREPCVRCELPNISRIDAARLKQPLKLIGTLSKSRPASKPASFGTYATALGDRLSVGMRSLDEA